MSVVQMSANQLNELCNKNLDALVQRIETVLRFSPSGAEQKSWRNSLPVLAEDLIGAGLGDVEVLLEFKLPLTSKRVDVILAGKAKGSSRDSYVVIELKQWSHASSVDDQSELVRVPGARYSTALHPSRQVLQYQEYMVDFLGLFSGETDAPIISACAYLHNANKADLPGLLTTKDAALAPIFTRTSRSELRRYLRTRLDCVPGVRAADRLQNSKIAPSKQLLSHAAEEIRHREQFVLLDEQRLAFNLVLDAVMEARNSDQKTVVVVTGGPGSGKSVIALSLLGEIARQGYTALHATGSRSFTMTLRKVAGNRAPKVQALFKYFNNFVDAHKNGIDVLLLDEAHRIREQSVNRYTPKKQRDRMGSQIDELLSAARVPVFLLDEKQVVRPGEMGTLREITTSAANRGFEVKHIDLLDQFRSGGSQLYVNWVLSALELPPDESASVVEDITRTELQTWPGDASFFLGVAESPEHMESLLSAKQRGGDTARITAGFCWPWSNATPNGLIADVVIGDWRRPWNSKEDRRITTADGEVIPPSFLWASDPGGFGQVGCVYTAQGFEYDWNGVIMGPDLVWRSDRWVPQPEYSKDPAFRGKGLENFDLLIRHVYKVLLTRGLKGTYVYSTDCETQSHLRSIIGNQHVGP